MMLGSASVPGAAIMEEGRREVERVHYKFTQYQTGYVAGRPQRDKRVICDALRNSAAEGHTHNTLCTTTGMTLGEETMYTIARPTKQRRPRATAIDDLHARA